TEFAADATALAAVEAAEHQLPKPGLDFESFPGVAEPKTKLFSGKATRSLSGPIGAVIALMLFLVAGGILMYKMGWLPKFDGNASKGNADKSAFPKPVSAGNGEPEKAAAGETVSAPANENTGAANSKHNTSVEKEPAEVSVGEWVSEPLPKNESGSSAGTSKAERKSAKPSGSSKGSSGEIAAAAVNKGDEEYVPPAL